MGWFGVVRGYSRSLELEIALFVCFPCIFSLPYISPNPYRKLNRTVILTLILTLLILTLTLLTALLTLTLTEQGRGNVRGGCPGQLPFPASFYRAHTRSI